MNTLLQTKTNLSNYRNQLSKLDRNSQLIFDNLFRFSKDSIKYVELREQITDDNVPDLFQGTENVQELCLAGTKKNVVSSFTSSWWNVIMFYLQMNRLLLQLILKTKAITKEIEDAIENSQPNIHCNRITKMREIKRHGLKYLHLLEELFYCYVFGFQKNVEHLPNHSELNECKTKFLSALGALKYNKFPLQKDFDNYEALEEILGLEGFSNFLKNIDSKYLDHQTKEYWAKEFLRRNYFEAEDEISSLTSSNNPDIIAILKLIGFSKERAASLKADLNREWSNQSPMYWVRNYVASLFKSHVLLNDVDELKRFPFNQEIVSVWLNYPNGDHKWQFINLLFEKDRKLKEFRFPSEEGNLLEFNKLITQWQEATKGRVFLFHSTDDKSAENICLEGIDLKEGKENQELSSNYGYYLYKDPTSALDYAFSGKFKSLHGKAILVYSVNENELDQYNCLDLVPKPTDNKEQSRSKNLGFQAIVNAHRSDEARRGKTKKAMREYDDFDFIISPTCSTTNNIGSAIAGMGRDTWQLCARSSKFSTFLNENLFRILFMRQE